MGYVVENRLTVAALHQRLRSTSSVQVGGCVAATLRSEGRRPAWSHCANRFAARQPGMAV